MSSEIPVIKNATFERPDNVFFERIFDATPTLIGVFQGLDHIYRYSNPAHDHAFGGRPLRGRALRDAVPELADKGLVERLDQVLRQGHVIEVPEIEVTLSDSSSNRRFYRYSLQPWHDENGAIAGVMSFAFDVTAEVEARMRAEASERHLSFALEVSSAVGVFEWDVKQDGVEVDRRFLAAFGLDPARANEPLPLTDFFAAIHDEDRDRVAEAVGRAVKTGEDYIAQYRVSGEDGRERRVLARGRCMRDANENPDRFTGVVVDITSQHRDKEALRESEARLRSVFSSIDQGYCVAEMIVDDAGTPIDYRFIDVNAQFEEMTGLKDAMGRTAMEMVPGLEQKWVDIYARVGLGGETMRFEEGSKAMGRWYDVFATPVQPRGRFALVFRNITLKKKLRESLLKSEAEFRTITEAMPQIVWAARPDGHHDFYNARWYEFTGVPEGSTDGEGWSELFHPDDQPAAWKLWRHSLATGEPYDVEYRLRHHSGQYRWALGRAQAVRNSDGEIVRWLGTCTDIHEMKVAGDQRQLMLDEMNHRVKNTLTIVNVMVSQTLRKAENLQEASIAIQSRIGMMSKAHDRLIKSNWMPTGIQEVVESALAPHRTGESRISAEGPDLALGSKQALALTMAIHELATNATKYGALSTPLGQITIGWSLEGGTGDTEFHLSWTESGGPPVTPPSRRGFGSRMVEQALAGYFDGRAELDYQPTGLCFELAAPVSGLTA